MTDTELLALLAEPQRPGIVGRVLDLTPRRIQQLAAEGVLPKSGRGRYPLLDCSTAYVRYLRDLAEQAPLNTSLDAARARKVAADADKAEIEVRRMRRDLVNIDDLEQLYSTPLAVLRARLLSLPGRIAAVLPMPAVEAVDLIEPVVHEFMAELSELDMEEALNGAG